MIVKCADNNFYIINIYFKELTYNSEARVNRIKLEIGAILMAAVMIMTDRAEILLIFYFSALLHETGHLIAAKLLGIKIKEIKIDFSGARICMEERLVSYKKELILSLSGPLVNFICVTACIAAFVLLKLSPEELTARTGALLLEGEQSCVGYVGFFALSSFLQGAVNLLPIRTLDGGRMLYCIIAMIFNESIAERVIDVFSALSALVLWTVALYLMLRLAKGFGIYVFAACLFVSTAKDSFSSQKAKRLNNSASL